jgi:hypothetical protein
MDLLLVKFVAVTKTAPVLMVDPLAKVMIFPLLGRPAWGANNTSNDGQPPGPDDMTKGVSGVIVKMGALATAGNANISSKAANLHTPLKCFIQAPFRWDLDFRKSARRVSATHRICKYKIEIVSTGAPQYLPIRLVSD